MAKASEPSKLWGGVGILSLGGFVVFLLALGVQGVVPVAWAVASVGIVTFFGVLMISNYLSKLPALEKAEFRQGIAAAIVAVYLSIFALLTFVGISPEDPLLSESMIGHFSAIVQVVIAFYFGAEAANFAASAWATVKLTKPPEKDVKLDPEWVKLREKALDML